MNSKILVSLLGVCAVIGLIAIVGYIKTPSKKAEVILPPVTQPTQISNPLNASYNIDGETITLHDGKFEREAAPGSASKDTFMLFGTPTVADLDGDGDQDAAMYITKNSGGSGTFFYVALAINNNGSYLGTNAMLLGDRIAPQNIGIMNGVAIANFAERKAGEPFTAQPSVGKSVYVHLDTKTNQIGEVVQNFEGEADPAKMTLNMKTWTWVKTDYTNGKSVSPKKVDVFALTFKSDGTLSVKTDCNGMGGSYTAKNGVLTLGNLISTLMYCDGSQESEFSAMLNAVTSYQFTSKGELVLGLNDNSGNIYLR